MRKARQTVNALVVYVQRHQQNGSTLQQSAAEELQILMDDSLLLLLLLLTRGSLVADANAAAGISPCSPLTTVVQHAALHTVYITPCNTICAAAADKRYPVCPT
jgi:hypothetical protein